MLQTTTMELALPSAPIQTGIVIGILSGLLVGILTILSDAIFYSRYVSDFRLARKYAKPPVQLLVFMVINIVYTGIQGALLAWLLPLLPSAWFLRGLAFGAASYLVLSRHFTEGIAFMNPEYFPLHHSLYLAIEFLVIYVLTGILISFGLMLASGI